MFACPTRASHLPHLPRTQTLPQVRLSHPCFTPPTPAAHPDPTTGPRIPHRRLHTHRPDSRAGRKVPPAGADPDAGCPTPRGGWAQMAVGGERREQLPISSARFTMQLSVRCGMVQLVKRSETVLPQVPLMHVHPVLLTAWSSPLTPSPSFTQIPADSTHPR
eukprot:357123-Chlamydomonas_euryale.AAC.6